VRRFFKVSVFSIGGLFISAWYSLWFTNYLVIATHFYTYFEIKSETELRKDIDLIIKTIVIQMVPPMLLLIYIKQYIKEVVIRINDLFFH
jgi:hypothetical protein